MENQVNLEEVKAELKEAEKSIQVERDLLTTQITEFQEYLEMQESEERKEAKLLQREQDELAMQEQQLLNTTKESDEDEDDRMRQNLSELLEKTLRLGKVSPSKEAAPLDPTNEQLQAELDRMRKQWEGDHLDWKQALNKVNQQLAEEETA